MEYLLSDLQLRFLLAHITINVLVAVGAAIKGNEFKFTRLLDFTQSKLAPYLIVYVASRMFAEAADMLWLSQTVFAALELGLFTDLTENLTLLGLPIPAGLKQLL